IPLGNGIYLFRIEFIEVADTVNEHHALKWLLRKRVISNGIVREIIKDFESDKIARCPNIDIPVED
ncbi:MAG: hypothetical protein Q9183_002728, partial [Haloplaca sp. 2 TL-2023]